MIKTLPGFRDLHPKELQTLNYIFKIWRLTAIQFGFVEYKTPVLEALRLYTDKSGPGIIKQLFSFCDKSDRQVAMRPENTPSLARVMGLRCSGFRKPVKWFSICECYRYERKQRGRLRAFYQLNIDIIGEKELIADVEIITAAIHTLRKFGMNANDFQLHLSDRSIWIHYLNSTKIKKDLILSVLNIVDRYSAKSSKTFFEKLIPYAKNYLRYFFDKLKKFLKLRSLGQLLNFLKKSKSVLISNQRKQIIKRLGDWYVISNLLERMCGNDFYLINFNIVRGLDYYTGFVFEVFAKNKCHRAVAGGGRYNDLMSKLGYEGLPAVGFAMGDVVLGDLLNEIKIIPKLRHKIDIFIIIKDIFSQEQALIDIMQLRNLNYKVDFLIKFNISIDDINTIDHSNSSLTISYSRKTTENRHVTVRMLCSNSRKLVLIN